MTTLIPKRYEKVKYEDVRDDIREKFDMIKDSRKGIYIHGPVGTGKTHTAFALKRKWDEISKNRAEFWNTSELL